MTPINTMVVCLVCCARCGLLWKETHYENVKEVQAPTLFNPRTAPLQAMLYFDVPVNMFFVSFSRVIRPPPPPQPEKNKQTKKPKKNLWILL